MLRNKVVILALLVYVAVILTIVPAVSAYMVQQTPIVQNDFVPANVSCAIVENFVPVDNPTTKEFIRVKNTSNVKAYIRIHLSTYWQDSKGSIVGRSSDALDDLASNLGSDWIRDPNNYHTYYYALPVAPEKETSDLLKDNFTLTVEHVTEEYKNGKLTIEYQYNQVIEVFAEAIQAEPTKAVTEAWGVTLTGDRITGVN